MQGHISLHVDQRDVVGEDVVQLLGNAQALLAGPTPRLLGADAPGLQRPFSPGADHLGHRQQDEQPSAKTDALAEGGRGAGSGDVGEPQERHVPEAQNAPGEGPPTHGHGGEEGDDQGDEDNQE